MRTMETIILSFVLLLYAIPRKSQALHRKFTGASSGPDNDHQAVFPAIDGLMADADTQLGVSPWATHLYQTPTDGTPLENLSACPRALIPVESKAIKLT